MKALTILFSVAICALTAQAQSDVKESPLRFDSTEWSFGDIKETDGLVAHTFSFVNVSDKAVRIDEVSTSCGCTTTSYPMIPIKSGDIGEIAVTFNPANTSGKVYREVYVLSNERKSSDNLLISAIVEPAPLTLREQCPVLLKDNIRIERNSCLFGYIAQGKSESKGVMIANSGNKSVKLRAEIVNEKSLLRVECPSMIGTESTDNLVLSYSLPIGKDYYGTIRDTVWIWADNERADKPIVVTAIMTDDFSDIGDDRPAIKILPTYVEFGDKPRNRIAKGKIEITNEGNADLIIRAIENDPGTSIDISRDAIIKPGGSILANVIKRSPSVSGSDITSSITLITNDPVRPQKEVRIHVATR